MAAPDPLAQAQDALHKLITTGGIVRMAHAGKEITYGPGNVAQLRRYIAELQGNRVTTIRVAASKGLDR